VSRARWSCLWRRTCGVKTAKRGRNSSLIIVLNISWYVCSTILFCKLLCLLNWIWWLLFLFFQETYNNQLRERYGNSIRIYGWRLDRQVDPINIGFTGSPTLRPTTCGRPVVFQPLGAPNQYRAPNLRSLWPCSNTRLSSPKNMTTYQRSMHYSKRLIYNKEQSLNNSKRLKHNKERSLNNKKRLMNSFAKWSWTWQHRVEHVRLILFGCITTSLLLQDLLLLQLHLYINL